MVGRVGPTFRIRTLFQFSFFERKRDRACEQGRDRERRRERIRSRLHTASTEPDTRLEGKNREIMNRAEVKSLTLNRLSHPGTPLTAGL